MVEGLLALRAKKIVHRDLSVSNILICPTGIKICDFDTAFIAGFSSQQDISITFNKYKMAP
jgi:serine/threonine protein kinase